jgi:hypothetical protein
MKGSSPYLTKGTILHLPEMTEENKNNFHSG